MAKEIFYTAVDIGTSKVCSIVARVGTEGELKILGTGVVASQGVQKGRIENIEEVQAAVRSSLEESQRYIGRGVISGVYAGVSGTHITCLNTKDFVNRPGDIGHIGADQLRDLIESRFPPRWRNPRRSSTSSPLATRWTAFRQCATRWGSMPARWRWRLTWSWEMPRFCGIR